jgi:hypothetical protein
MEEQDLKLQNEQALIGFIHEIVQLSEDSRRDKEEAWLQALRDIRGEYSPEQRRIIQRLRETNPLSSSAFIRVTSVKSLAAYGNMLEILFSNNEFPIYVQPTPIPDGVSEVAHISIDDDEDTEDDADPIGFNGDGIDVPPGATPEVLGGLRKKFSKLLKAGASVKDGSPLDPANAIKVNPAIETAANMQKQLQDQFTEMKADKDLSAFVWELCHLGTACIKGPVTKKKIKHRWVYDEETGAHSYEPDDYLSPDISHVSIWNLYAHTSTGDLQEGAVVERHLISPHKLSALKFAHGFDSEAVDYILKYQKPEYTRKYWENDLRDENVETPTERYEMLEYWGYVTQDIADRFGIEYDSDSPILINAFVCNDRVLKVAKNPFIPQRIPYYIANYQEDPYSIWGDGIPFLNKDTQEMVNTHWRAAQDNLNLAGSVMLELDERKMVPGQDYNIHPGKMFFTKGTNGQVINPIRLNDTSQSHFIAVDKIMQFGDDATGIPRFFTGSGNLSSSVRTAAQTSMLMGSTALNIKTVIKGIDRDLLAPLGEAMYHWNMQFNDSNPIIRGDIEVKAGGMSALLQKEVKSQRLLSYAQVISGNPILAAKTDWDYINKELAKANDLDPNKVINSEDKAKENAMLMQLLGGNQNVDGTGQGAANGPIPPTGEGGGQPPAGPAIPGTNPTDVSGTGNGNIGVGNVPQAGESNFTG